MDTVWAVRPAIAADAELLGAMNRRLIQDEGHRNRMGVPELVERMRGWLAAEYRAWLLEAGGAPIAYCLARDDGDHVYIRQLWVEPAARGEGAGRHLVEHLARTAWSGRRLRLEVLIGNQRAIAFWRALGFADNCLTLERLPGSPPPAP